MRFCRSPIIPAPFPILWRRSQNAGAPLPNVQTMRAKYYTRFLLRSAEPGFADEYSGVVELSHAVNQVLEPHEIAAVLAENFHRDQQEVELLNWSRVH